MGTARWGNARNGHRGAVPMPRAQPAPVGAAVGPPEVQELAFRRNSSTTSANEVTSWGRPLPPISQFTGPYRLRDNKADHGNSFDDQV